MSAWKQVRLIPVGLGDFILLKPRLKPGGEGFLAALQRNVSETHTANVRGHVSPKCTGWQRNLGVNNIPQINWMDFPNETD